MSAVRTIACGDWAEFTRDLFVELYGGAPFQRGRYLFRGAGDADWRLTSSFDRAFEAVPLQMRMQLWERLTEQWREGCREAGVAEDVTTDDHSLWALGQHHGLPTRMLDWSMSPYVAAFFAFRAHLLAEAGRGGQVAVWVLHLDNPVWSGPGVDVVAAPALGNLRLRNQGGRFTLCRAAVGSLDEYVQRMATGTALTRCLLPAAAATVALGELDAMGITDHQLFPDLTGLADMATMRAALSVLPGHDGWR